MLFAAMGSIEADQIHHYLSATPQTTAYLILYVEDILLTASSASSLQDIMRLLSKEFSMTDFGTLNYFLGYLLQATFQVCSCLNKSMLLTSWNANMLKYNPCRTPADTQTKLSVDGTPVSDPTLYQCLEGALQYLTFTIPDISYAVHQICLFMHDPREPHLLALKRILRYIRGTIDHGLQFHSSPADNLIAYTDAD